MSDVCTGHCYRFPCLPRNVGGAVLGTEASHLGSVTQGVAYKVLFCLSVCLSLFVSPCAANNEIVEREKLTNKCSVVVYPWFVL